MKAPNLLIQTAFIGDLLLAIPLMRRLKELDCERPLALVCRQGLGDFFLATKCVDFVYEVNKADPQSLRRLQAQLKAQKFHWILCPHQSLRSALLCSGLQAQIKVGFRLWWNFFAFDLRLKRPRKLPDALRQLSLVAALDPELAGEMAHANTQSESCGNLRILSWSELRLKAEQWPKDKQNVLEWIFQAKEKKGIVMLAPGSQWATKRWTPEGFIEVGRKLAQLGFQIFVVGVAAEREIGEQVAKAISSSRNLCGQTSLIELGQLMRKARLLVCNDSGAMHLACAAGLDLVSVFGPTTPELGYRPWSERALIAQIDLPCRPCGTHGAERCPIGTHACMNDISSQRVLQLAHQLLASN